MGTLTATGNSSLITDKYNLIYNLAVSGNGRTVYATFKDTPFGFEATAKTENNPHGLYATDIRSGYSYIDGTHLASASLIKWNTASNVTTCDIKIYAR